MHKGAAMMENGTEVPKKSEQRGHGIQQPHFWAQIWRTSQFEMTCAPLFSGKHIYNSQDTKSTKMSSNRNMKTECYTYTLDYSSGSGGGIRMGECGPLTSSWLEEGRPALRVGFPEVCRPQCPDGLHPQWGRGQDLSPFDEATTALDSEVS